MSNPIFVIFKDVMINVEDISWSRVDTEPLYFDPDNPWSMTINFKGVSQFIRFHHKTQKEAKASHWDFQELVNEAIRTRQ